MVIPNEGKELWLYWALVTDGSDLEDFILDLFKNDYTPVDGSSAADFTPSDFGGYAQIAVGRADFGAPAITSNVAYSTLSFVPTWTVTSGSPQNAYGWYLRGADSDIVLAAQRFDSARVMAIGATQTLDPFRIGLKSIT